jgi:hypothetical protein
MVSELGYSAVAVASHPIIPPAADGLIDALTIEGLLFAAYAFAVRLAEPTTEGRSPFFAQAWFGWLFVLAIAAAAISAGACWWDAYKPSTLEGINNWLRAAGLLSGIIAPPIFAAIINWQARA